MNPLRYLSEVRSELSLVVWPKVTDVTRLTVLVVLISIIVGIYLGLLDAGFTKLIGLIITN
ncbi:hypothetical protein BH10PAT1_BH10PAT1_0040 [soil metagenome]